MASGYGLASTKQSLKQGGRGGRRDILLGTGACRMDQMWVWVLWAEEEPEVWLTYQP